MLKQTISPSLRRRYHFFLENAGGIVGERALGALSLARAEEEAEARGWVVLWRDDDDHDAGPRDWGWDDKDVEKWEESEHTCEWAALYIHPPCSRCGHSEEYPVASLGGIWDASSDYRRVVAAELALEALEDVKRQAA